MKDRILRGIYKRYMSWRLSEIVFPQYPILLEYPITPVPRYGYGKPSHPVLEAIIARQIKSYAETIRLFIDYGDALSSIACNRSEDDIDPTFSNTYFSGLDAIALYSLLSAKKPKTFFEIGSGHSTRFARRAIKDNSLQTRIVLCDPQPRAEIDAICDEVIREPFETLDLSALDTLHEGDFLFIDSSHRCFTNSDVTVEFLEAIPRLNRGVFVHIHDILLPYDYPPEWSGRHYSEQYLLASYLLGGGGNTEIVLPNAYVSTNGQLTNLIDPLWQLPGMAAILSHTRSLYHGYLGFSFWLKKTA